MTRSIAVLAAALALIAAPAMAQETPTWSFAIHGGAGVIERDDLSPERDAAYRAALQTALKAGSAVLANGGSALDAVQAAVQSMEDNPLFNAGRGAVFTAAGKNELDAAVMNGSDLTAGAVAGLTTTRHPIAAARAVMEQSPHVMLIGDGADSYTYNAANAGVVRGGGDAAVDTLVFNGGSLTVSNQPADTWSYFLVNVPSNAVGWADGQFTAASEPRVPSAAAAW